MESLVFELCLVFDEAKVSKKERERKMFFCLDGMDAKTTTILHEA